MKLSKQDAFDAVRSGLELLRKVGPVAASFGLPQVSAIAAVTAAVGNELLNRAEDGAEALTITEEGELKAMLAEIQPINDELARQVAAS